MQTSDWRRVFTPMLAMVENALFLGSWIRGYTQPLASEMLNLCPRIHSHSKNAGPRSAKPVFLYKLHSALFPRLYKFHFLLSSILVMPFNPEDFQFGMKIWIPNTPRGGEASLHVIVQSLNHVWIFAAPQTAARQASLSISNSQSLPKLMSTEWVMPSSHLILCRPLLLPPSIFPSMKEYVSVKFHLAQPLAVCQLLYAFHTRLHFLEACASVRLACSYFNDKRKVKECQRACTWRAWRAENVNRKSIPDPAPGHPLPPPQAFHPNSACSWFLSTSRKETVTVSLFVYLHK